MVSRHPQSKNSNEAILTHGTLICYQCHRIQCKREDIARLPLLKRWKKKVDLATGIFTALRKLRSTWNQIWYFKVRGGKPTTRIPLWMEEKADVNIDKKKTELD